MEIQTRISQYSNYITIVIVIILIAALGYILSKNYRVNSKVISNELNLPNNMIYQTDYCSPRLGVRKLVDFHIKSSHASALSGFQKADYVSTDMIKNVLANNVRYLEFSLFSKEQNNDSEPVVSSGYKRGNWKLTANVLSFREVLSVIKEYAFSEAFITNYNDPLFIYLDIKTEFKGTLNQCADLIIQQIGDRILDNRYRYQHQNIADTPMCNLMDRIVIMSNSGFGGTRLEEFINISESNGNLQRLEYSDVIIRKNFNVNAPDLLLKSNKISFHKGIGINYIQLNDYSKDFRELGFSRGYSLRLSGSKKPQNNTGSKILEIDSISKDKISFKKSNGIIFNNEEFGEEIFVSGYKIRALEAKQDLVDMNKNILTIVVPDYDFFSLNFNPKDIWYSGAQFVAMNYQTIDENLRTYQYFFSKRAIKLKQTTLLRKLTEKDKEKTKMNTRNKLLSQEPDKVVSYPINYDFIRDYIDSPIKLATFNNNELFWNIQTSDAPIKIGLETTESKSLFSFELSPNQKFKNSINIIINLGGEKMYLGKYEKDSNLLTFKKKTNEIEDFIDKTSFMPLEPICRKNEYVSIGYINREKINEKLIDVLYYIKYKPSFSEKNNIYKTNTNKYKKLGSLEFKMNDSVKKVFVYRPLRQKKFRPLGDIIIGLDEVPINQIFKGEIPISNIRTTLVNGAVKPPIGYTEIYNNGNIIKGDEQYFSIWKPKAPDGYIALSNVFKFERGSTPPSREIIYCVRADLVKPIEFSFEEDVGSLKKLDNVWFNKEIGLWTKYNISSDYTKSTMRYFSMSYNIDKNTGGKYFGPWNKGSELSLRPPSDLDNPLYEIKDTSDIINDNLFLDNKNVDSLNKEACCFKVIRSYTDGEFTEYNLYNNLNDVIDSDYKIINYETNRNGNQQCVNVPYSYWNDYYQELKPIKGVSLSEKMRESVFIKSSLDGTDDSNFIANIPMDNQGCRNLTGTRVDKPSCNIKMATNNDISTKFYINKLDSCPRENKVGEMKITVPVEDCRIMGGKPSAERGISDCSFEVCNNVFNKHSIIIPKNKTVEDNVCMNYNKTQGFFMTPDKKTCDSLNGKFNSQTNFCEKPICYNPTPVKAKLRMGGCRDSDYFGTNFSLKGDNTIRLKNNTNYCLSANLDKNGRALPNSHATIQGCNSEKRGQQFIKETNGNIKYKSSNSNIGTNENLCLTSNLDSTLTLKTCVPTNNFQKWSFTELPSNFCISVGSVVFLLDKKTFVRTPKKFPGTVVNTPVENLLKEEYDYNYIHAYVAATIVAIDNKKNYIYYKMINTALNNYYFKTKSSYEKVIDSTDKILKISFQEAFETFILDYKPPTDRLKLGTKVLVNNGELNFDSVPYINLTSQNVKFYGVITEELENGNYKVFMSINSIEPNKKNKSFGRPNYSQVKSINIDDIVLYKKSYLC